VTKPLVIYPFEPDLYAEYGVDAEYVGHPLFDHLEQLNQTESRTLEGGTELGDRAVALFPGSRKQEIRANLPIMLEAAERLQNRYPGLQFASAVPSKMRSVTEELLKNSAVNVTFPDVDAPTLANACELCLTKSGTITLEIAAMGTPMIIFYRLNPFLYFVGAGITETPYIGLINNLSGHMICPEKAMPWSDVDWVVEQADDLLGDSQYYKSCRREMEKTLEGFAEPGASVRAARAACELLP
jgi:lipid-A-disaccharide synthase